MSNFVIPQTEFEIIDNSAFQKIALPEKTSPVYFCAFASSKGSEQIQVINDNFEKHYGSDISFEKYGQPLLQAAVASNNGAVVIAKRVVAPDATLANTAVLATLSTEKVQKKDKDGKPLYTDKITSQETTEKGDSNEPIMIDQVKIKYDCQTVTNCKSLEEVSTTIESKLDEAKMTYPLFLLTDNGRGLSNKKFRVAPNYSESKNREQMVYNLMVIENNKIIENIPFSFNHTTIEYGMNRALDSMIRQNSTQLKCRLYEDNIDKFIAKISELSKLTPEYVNSIDTLFGKDRRGTDIQGLVVDFESEDAFNLSDTFGLDLESGTNGAFGENPLATDEYKQELIKFFGGEFSDDIYDVDKYKIDLILDANYPDEVKAKIAELVTFREDCMFIRDLGLKMHSVDEAVLRVNEDDLIRNKYILDNYLTYDVLDPYTKKPIKVTVNYSLSKILIHHFENGRHRPLAGIKNKFILSDAIEGTVNFIPKVTPRYNQKEVLSDNKINFASYYGDELVYETFWTSQDKLTQLSFANNVLAIQEVIKAVRTKCPSIRYSFNDGEDLEKYKEDVNEVLDKYSGNFYKLKMVYLQDDTMIANKVFYAAIEVTCRDFNMAEKFKVYVLRKEAN